jgi:DNA primase
VSFGPAFDAKEQVRQAVDIVDLVGSYAQLRRQGRNFVALCPWHDDSRPSLQVNPDRQSFKCWVCDYGGDVFSFIMRAEGLDFREALELLAERAGIQLQRANASHGDQGGPPPRPENDKRTLHRVMAWADDQFHRCLIESPLGEPGRQYLAERGISPETAAKFHLGFAPDRWDWLLELARGSEWSTSILERVGLLRRRDTGDGSYDWFRGRVMFSIRDARGRAVAFGGRVLPQLADEHAAKYINSPETPLFSKSRELYGLDMARDHFKSGGGAIVMEGYTDCLMAHQNGINHCVAVLGTALGERHLQLLRRYTDSITLVLDGDDAGRRRTNEILDNLLSLFEKNQVDLRILTLPQGVDPCDFIATHGSDPFRRLLSEAVDALEHKFKVVTNGLDTLTDTHRASQAAEQMLATLASIRPAAGDASSQALLREEQMLSRIARKFHLPEDKLRSRLGALRRNAQRRPSPGYESMGREAVVPPVGNKSLAIKLSEMPVWDRDLLQLLILDPSMAARVAGVISPSRLASEVARRIYAACCRLAEAGWRDDFGRLMAEFDDPAMKNLLVELDESSATKSAGDRERWLADLLDTDRRNQEETEQRTRLAAARHDAGDADQLLAQFCKQSKSKHLSDFERRKK